jgi:hypothetical protein
MAKQQISFNVLLDPERHRNLCTLARELGISRGAVLRQLLDSGFNHIATKIPTCANGHNCFVPHMHHYAPPPEQPPSNSQTQTATG